MMMHKLLTVMKNTAYACGRILLDQTKEALFLQFKTSMRDVVTQYDVEVQRLIVDRLHREFPEAGFINEEGENGPDTASEIRFVVDPIDGTTNFVKNMHHSSISIGCLGADGPIAGVVYDPYMDEMFWAGKGMGAHLNDMPISIDRAPLCESLVLYGMSPYNLEVAEHTFGLLKDLYFKCLDLRRLGSAALDLCYVACGRAGLYFEERLSLWDYAAGALIVEEAGGRVSDLDGHPLRFTTEKSSLICGTEMTIAQSELCRR